MFKYFRDLLETLHSIEESLKKLSNCVVHRDDKHRGPKDVMVSATWQDTTLPE